MLAFVLRDNAGRVGVFFLAFHLIRTQHVTDIADVISGHRIEAQQAEPAGIAAPLAIALGQTLAAAA